MDRFGIPSLSFCAVDVRQFRRRHEFSRQPIQQCRVTRVLGLRPEVLGGFDQAGSKEMFPRAVNPNTSGQRVGWIDYPVGQSQTVHLFAFGQRWQHAW